MAETINLVYIGSKPEKKDTAYGTDLVFPAGVAVPVPTDIAPKLLKHKDVWVKESDVEEIRKEQKVKADFDESEKLRLEAEATARAEYENLALGDYGDLGKYTLAKLKTLVESESLSIEPYPGELVREFAYRVRDALKLKVPTESGKIESTLPVVAEVEETKAAE